jgi:hypothetical protein
MSDVQTPSQRIIAASNPTFEFTDTRGRKLVWRAPGVIDQVRLMRAIGAEQSKNEPYVQLVNVACSIVSIDGIVRPAVTNERQIDAAIIALGDEGVLAISAFMKKQISDAEAAAEAALNGEGDEVEEAHPLQVSGQSTTTTT